MSQATTSKVLLLWMDRHASNLIDKRIAKFYARRYGAQLKITVVGGYPKSGTTWIAKMLAHALDLTYLNSTAMLMPYVGAVIHNHWNYDPRFVKPVYITRDGRDVMVSNYMFVMKNYTGMQTNLSQLGSASPARAFVGSVGHYGALKRRLVRVLGAKFDPWDVDNNLARYIEADLQKPILHSVELAWHKHIQNWLSHENVISTSYETMLDDPRAALTRILQASTGQEPNPEDVDYTVRRYSFERSYGRKPGEENRKSFGRKGVNGDWVNHFSAEARQVFDHYAGDMLIQLGYEADHTWASEQSVTPTEAK